MAKSIFNKKLTPACCYCVHGRPSEYTEEIFCLKKGITEKYDSCRHYKYDVFKRTPTRTAPASDYKPEDFSL